MEGANRRRIRDWILTRKSATGPELAARLGITRQAAHRHLKALALDGEIVKLGATRGAVWVPAGADPAQGGPRVLRRTLRLRGLEEDQVFHEVSAGVGAGRWLSPRGFAILRYAFTEILNNAIEHSGAERCRVEIALEPYDCAFLVREAGVGLFHSIRRKLRLPDEETALGLLLKGKTTTMKERHSGEGIFFTSRAADRMTIRSHRILLAFDNRMRDTHVEETRFLHGTEVRFWIARGSRRDLTRIFREHAPEEYDHEFQKTRVLVRLYLPEYVSRSEARRMSAGLENFREVVLDFTGVRRIGQGFADEIFRVFPRHHPGIQIRAEHASAVVREMIRHVVDSGGFKDALP